MEAERRITVAELAELAQVSVPTISKVLNNRPGVSDETRERVRGVIRDVGYAPRNTAHRNKTRTIELLISHPHTAWADEILVGTLEGLADSGFSPIVSARPPAGWDFGEWHREVRHHNSSGAMICLTHVAEEGIRRLHADGMRTIMIDPTGIVPPNTPVIGSADYQGCKDATRHLVELGHTRIAFLQGPEEWQTCRARYDGFRSVMEEAGLEIDPQLIMGERYYYEDGYECANRLFEMTEPPTAIFASSDMQAAGAYRAAHEHGVRIPDDVSIVGFDDLPYINFLQPRLTTVHHAIQDMARLGAQTLVELIEGKEPLTHVDLAAPLVVRESTSAPRGA